MLMHPRSWLAAAVLMAWASGPVDAAPAKKPALTFGASLDKASYAANEPILTTFTLTNGGKQPVWVNSRFYVSSNTLPRDDRDVYLTVRSASGKELECTFTHPTGFPKTDYFKLLQPEAAVSSEHPRDLRAFFKFEEPGTYTLTATYDNAFGPEIGLEAAQGPLTAAPVTLTITP